MTTSVLVVVDVQRDFCAGGALEVPGADAILPVVNGLITAFERVIVTQDWHPPGHVSFASSHPGRRVGDRLSLTAGTQLLWPDHCVAGSAGAELHPDLRLPAGAAVLRKGVRGEADAYSAFFELDGVTPVGLEGLLREADAREFVLVGMATDFCVVHTALDGRRLGYDVTVVEAGCRGIGATTTVPEAWQRMAAAGVRRA